MNDQATQLRAIMQTSAADAGEQHEVCGGAPLAGLIVVAGAKGGVGTTTVAANLAAMLVSLGESAVLVDADFAQADATELCHIVPQRTLTDVLADRADPFDVLQRHETGLRILPAAWAPQQPLEPSATMRQRLAATLAQLARRARFTIVDAGSAGTKLTQQLCLRAALTLLITTCDDASVTNAYSSLKLLAPRNGAGRLATLANLVDDYAAADAVQDRLETAARRFLGATVESAGHLIRCPIMEHQRRTGWLGAALPTCEAKSFFHRLAMTEQLHRDRTATAPVDSDPSAMSPASFAPAA
ncbi:MAG: hypothetical protein DWQ42_15435 [Planctomycetota bacterium]|nr:MAG: hypothetical protein DWQ42_15435 [Planctomycetota bacterium]